MYLCDSSDCNSAEAIETIDEVFVTSDHHTENTENIDHLIAINEE